MSLHGSHPSPPPATYLRSEPDPSPPIDPLHVTRTTTSRTRQWVWAHLSVQILSMLPGPLQAGQGSGFGLTAPLQGASVWLSLHRPLPPVETVPTTTRRAMCIRENTQTTPPYPDRLWISQSPSCRDSPHHYRQPEGNICDSLGISRSQPPLPSPGPFPWHAVMQHKSKNLVHRDPSNTLHPGRESMYPS